MKFSSVLFLVATFASQTLASEAILVLRKVSINQDKSPRHSTSCVVTEDGVYIEKRDFDLGIGTLEKTDLRISQSDTERVRSEITKVNINAQFRNSFYQVTVPAFTTYEIAGYLDSKEYLVSYTDYFTQSGGGSTSVKIRAGSERLVKMAYFFCSSFEI